MSFAGIKMDMHVHSNFSTRPSQWFLQKLNAPESFSEPKKIYKIAKSRGMHLVTITDHNQINGCLELADLKDTLAQELIEKGIKEEKILFYPRGIDTAWFNPVKRNGFWESKFQLKKDAYKLLYV